LFDRRISGSLNLRLSGRGDRYRQADERGRFAVQQIIAEAPDAVVFGGDATSLSEPEEFERAAEVLAPLLGLGVPCIALAGNHDRYTRAAQRERRFEHAFADWTLIQSEWESIEIKGCTVHFADTAQANAMVWDSRGRALSLPSRPPKWVFAHYAVIDHRAQPDHKWHALRNELEVRTTLRDGPGTTWCCGHLHRSFASQAGGLVEFCAGSVGGPKGHWQMLELEDGQVRRQAWSKDGPGRTSKLR
jgi:predicted phosphodiesterase